MKMNSSQLLQFSAGTFVHNNSHSIRQFVIEIIGCICQVEVHTTQFPELYEFL